VLYEHNANPAVQLNDGRTALHIATQEGNFEILKILVEHGIDIDTTDETGESAVFDAIRARNENCAEFLLQQNPNTNIINSRGKTLLHIAAHTGLTDIGRLLLATNTVVGTQDKEGNTALHDCFTSEFTIDTMVELLLTHGCNPLIKNQKGETALDLAERSGHSTLAITLKKAMEEPRFLKDTRKDTRREMEELVKQTLPLLTLRNDDAAKNETSATITCQLSEGKVYA
jgi:ankyrin repeat protein